MLSHDLRVAQLCLPFIEFDWPEFMPSTLDSLMKQVVLSLKISRPQDINNIAFQSECKVDTSHPCQDGSERPRLGA